MIAVRLRGFHLRFGPGTLAVLAVTAIGLAPASGVAPWLAMLVAILLALTIHETARVWTWRRLGVRVRGLDVAVFGARPVLADSTVRPKAEAWAGFAGLLALAVPAAGLLVASTGDGRDLAPIARWVGALALLQAMPALPLDGGRIARAWVWYLTDDAVAGTRAAAVAAYLITSATAGVGGALFLLDPGGTLSYWGVWLLVAGWQIGGATRAEVRHARWQRDAQAITVGDAVAARARAIAGATTLADAVEPLLAAGPDAVLLVTGDDGRPLGVLRPANLRRVRRADWDERTVAEAMSPLADLPRLSADRSLGEAVELLTGRRQTVAVVERADTPIAAVTVAQLAGPLPRREDTAAESPLADQPTEPTPTR